MLYWGNMKSRLPWKCSWESPCSLKVMWQTQFLERCPASIFSALLLLLRIIKLLETVNCLTLLFLSLTLDKQFLKDSGSLLSVYIFSRALHVLVYLFCSTFCNAHWLVRACFYQITAVYCIQFDWSKLQPLVVYGELHLWQQKLYNDEFLLMPWKVMCIENIFQNHVRWMVFAIIKSLHAFLF